MNSVRAMPTPCSPASEPLNCRTSAETSLAELAELLQILRRVQVQHGPHVQQSGRGMAVIRSLQPQRRHQRFQPRDVCRQFSGRTAVSSMPVTGLASPLRPVISESPALRNAHTSSASVRAS